MNIINRERERERERGREVFVAESTCGRVGDNHRLHDMVQHIHTNPPPLLALGIRCHGSEALIKTQDNAIG